MFLRDTLMASAMFIVIAYTALGCDRVVRQIEDSGIEYTIWWVLRGTAFLALIASVLVFAAILTRSVIWAIRELLRA